MFGQVYKGIALAAAFYVTVAQAQTPQIQTQKEHFVIDMPADATSLDPHLQWDTDSYMVYRNIFDNLLTRNDKGEITGQVATDWRYLDERTLEFTLRRDIRFHDGSPLSVDDVVFSIRRIINPALKSPQLSQYDQIESVEALGPDKILLKTKSTYPVLLAQLVKLSIVPKVHVEKVGDQQFNLAPVGSGPYRLAAWQKGVGTELVAHEAYWGGKPPFPKVSFRVVPDLATRVADLKTGRADLTRGLTPDQANDLKKDSNLKILSNPTERIGYLFINALYDITSDPRVRQAIAYAVNRKAILEALLNGYAEPVDVMVTPASFGYIGDIGGYPYDPAKARALIREAGAEGKTLTFLLSPVYDARVAQAIQQMLNDVGFKVEVQMMDMPTFLRRRMGKPEEAGHLSLGRWSCACQDADGILFPALRSGQIYSKFAHSDFDRAVDAARTTIKPEERLKHYRAAYEVLKQQMPSLPLYQDYAIYAARKELQWQPTPAESMTLMSMKWVPKAP